jgi:hypothetical protein
MHLLRTRQISTVSLVLSLSLCAAACNAGGPTAPTKPASPLVGVVAFTAINAEPCLVPAAGSDSCRFDVTSPNPNVTSGLAYSWRITNPVNNRAVVQGGPSAYPLFDCSFASGATFKVIVVLTVERRGLEEVETPATVTRTFDVMRKPGNCGT